MKLDVGCGSRPSGDVNIDIFRSGFNPQTGDQVKGMFVDPKTIKNFVVADTMHLPFKDATFDVSFSSHTIEHVKSPFLMLQEMIRVAKRKVVVRFPHRKGSGAVMPHHINYFDEDWFKKASDILGVESRQFVTVYEGPFTPKFKKICPKALAWFLKIPTYFEKKVLGGRKFHRPFEMEIWIRKRPLPSHCEKVKYIVVYNNPITFKRCFASSPYISPDQVIAIHNIKNESLPKLFNKIVKENQDEDVWFVFCHQDFILEEDLAVRLKDKDIDAVYGPIGVRYGFTERFGMIIQTNNTKAGIKLKDDAPVQTLDEMCLIANSQIFRQGLSFDEQFRFHFYGADLCLQAHELGFNVLAMQINCQHKSRTLTGDTTSQEYLLSLNAFKDKWKNCLPVRTTTILLENSKIQTNKNRI